MSIKEIFETMDYGPAPESAAEALAWLVDQGRLDYDAPIAEVWPEFAQAGKADVTLAQALSHQAGLPGYPTEMEPADWLLDTARRRKIISESCRLRKVNVDQTSVYGYPMQPCARSSAG